MTSHYGAELPHSHRHDDGDEHYERHIFGDGDDDGVDVDVGVVAQNRKSIASKAFVFCADEFARKALKEASKVREA